MERGQSRQKASKKVKKDHATPPAPSVLDLPEGGVDIDGSILEGGGQILRNSAALAAITGTPIRVSKIRANRSNPGLRPQHLAGLQLVTEICSGQLEGGHVGSSTITLVPGRLQGGSYSANPGTAGSCTLLAQAAMPALLFASAEAASPSGGSALPKAISLLELRGGTDADMAPPVGYMQQVLLPTLRRLYGLHIDDQLDKRGFYPKGGGSLALSVQALSPGKSLPAIQLVERGDVKSVHIHAFTAGRLKPEIAERLATSAELCLETGLGRSVPIPREICHYSQKSEPAAFGDGCGILLVADTESGCLLGEASPGRRGVPAEDIGRQAAEQLVEDLETGACVDRWMEDQIIIFMALAEGESVITCGEPSLHTRTAMTIAEQLTSARFAVEPPDTTWHSCSDGRCYFTIRCKGAGVKA